MIAPRSSCPGGECTPLRGVDLRINTRSTTLSQRSDARGLVSQVSYFSPASGGAAVGPPVRNHRLHLKSVHSAWCPLTATHHWRRGPLWPAKVAPSPSATNRACRVGRSAGRHPHPGRRLTQARLSGSIGRIRLSSGIIYAVGCILSRRNARIPWLKTNCLSKGASREIMR